VPCRVQHPEWYFSKTKNGIGSGGGSGGLRCWPMLRFLLFLHPPLHVNIFRCTFLFNVWASTAKTRICQHHAHIHFMRWTDQMAAAFGRCPPVGSMRFEHMGMGLSCPYLVLEAPIFEKSRI